MFATYGTDAVSVVFSGAAARENPELFCASLFCVLNGAFCPTSHKRTGLYV